MSWPAECPICKAQNCDPMPDWIMKVFASSLEQAEDVLRENTEAYESGSIDLQHLISTAKLAGAQEARAKLVGVSKD